MDSFKGETFTLNDLQCIKFFKERDGLDPGMFLAKVVSSIEGLKKTIDEYDKKTKELDKIWRDNKKTCTTIIKELSTIYETVMSSGDDAEQRTPRSEVINAPANVSSDSLEEELEIVQERNVRIDDANKTARTTRDLTDDEGLRFQKLLDREHFGLDDETADPDYEKLSRKLGVSPEMLRKHYEKYFVRPAPEVTKEKKHRLINHAKADIEEGSESLASLKKKKQKLERAEQRPVSISPTLSNSGNETSMPPYSLPSIQGAYMIPYPAPHGLHNSNYSSAQQGQPRMVWAPAQSIQMLQQQQQQRHQHQNRVLKYQVSDSVQEVDQFALPKSFRWMVMPKHDEFFYVFSQIFEIGIIDIITKRFTVTDFGAHEGKLSHDVCPLMNNAGDKILIVTDRSVVFLCSTLNNSTKQFKWHQTESSLHYISCCAFTQDDKHFILGSVSLGNCLCLVETETLNIVRTFGDLNSMMMPLAQSVTLERCIDKFPLIKQNGYEVQVPRHGGSHGTKCVCVSLCGKFLFCTGSCGSQLGGGVYVWSLTQFRFLGVIQPELYYISGLYTFPDGEHLLCSTKSGIHILNIYAWDKITLVERSRPLSNYDSSGFSPLGNAYAEIFNVDPWKPVLYRCDTLKYMHCSPSHSSGSSLNYCVVRTKGDKLDLLYFAVGTDNKLYHFKVRDNYWQVFDLKDELITFVCHDASENHLYVVSQTNYVIRLDIQGNILQSFKCATGSVLFGLHVMHFNNCCFLLTCDRSGRIVLWNTESNVFVSELSLSRGTVKSWTFSALSTVYVATSEGYLIEFEVRKTGITKVKEKLIDATDVIVDICASSKSIYCATCNGVVIEIDRERLEEERRIKLRDSSICSLSINKKGTLLSVVNEIGGISLVSIEEWKEVEYFIVPLCSHVEFDDKNCTLICGCANYAVYLISLDRYTFKYFRNVLTSSQDVLKHLRYEYGYRNILHLAAFKIDPVEHFEDNHELDLWTESIAISRLDLVKSYAALASERVFVTKEALQAEYLRICEDNFEDSLQKGINDGLFSSVVHKEITYISMIKIFLSDEGQVSRRELDHIRKKHVDPLRARLCPLCKRDDYGKKQHSSDHQKNVKNMISHVNSCLPEDSPFKKRFRCNKRHCNRSFSAKADLINHHKIEHPPVTIESAAKIRKKRKVNDEYKDDGLEIDVLENASGRDPLGILDVADQLENDFHLEDPATATAAIQKVAGGDLFESLLSPNLFTFEAHTAGVVDKNPTDLLQYENNSTSQAALETLLATLNPTDDHSNTNEDSIGAMDSFNDRKMEPLIGDLEDFDFFLDNLDKYTQLEELHLSLHKNSYYDIHLFNVEKKARRLASLGGKTSFIYLERLTLCEDAAGYNISLLSSIPNLFKNTPKLEYLRVSPSSLNGELFQEIKERGCFQTCRHLLVDLHIDKNLRIINEFISGCKHLKTISFRYLPLDDHVSQTIKEFVKACKGKDLRFIRSVLVTELFDNLPRTLSLLDCVWGRNVSDEDKSECFRKVVDKCSHLEMRLSKSVNAVKLRDVLRHDYPAVNLKTIVVSGVFLRSEVLHLMQFCKDYNITATFE
ncbi:hypothetical protein MP638_006266 [Amoeboaphelidium occidentale]|nr:hypothetical protein MP638_006266 [Amoeboaphelidium occidentale]